MFFKFWQFLFLFFLTKSFAVESEPEILDIDFFESSQNESDKVVIDAESSDPDIQLAAIKELQNLLKQEEYLNDFVENERLPVLIKCLNSENTTIQLEAIYAISEIANSSVRNAKEVNREKAVPHFIRLLHSSNTTIAAQSIHIVNILISQDPKLRNQILKLGFAEHLVELIEPSDLTPEIVNEIARVLLAITINDDYPLPKEAIDTLVPAFKKLINHTNPNIVSHISWALKFLTDDGNSKYSIYLDKNAIKDIMKLMNHAEPKIQMAAVGIIKNVVIGNNEQIKFVMDYGILKLLPKLLMHENDLAIQYTLLLLSKLFDVSEAQTTRIFDTGIIPLIIFHLAQKTDKKVEEVAVFAITFATKFATSKQISYMIDMNLINAMCQNLLETKINSDDTVQIILLGYDRVLSKAANRSTEIHQKLEKCGGLEVISLLEKHQNDNIRNLAFDIIGTYCGGSA